MKIEFTEMISVLHAAEILMKRDEEDFKDELKFIKNLIEFLLEGPETYYEIKGSDPF